MIQYCRIYDTFYDKDSEDGKIGIEQSKKIIEKFPNAILQILKKLSEYMEEQRITREDLFSRLDSDGNGAIDRGEFTKFCSTNNIIQGITSQQVDKLFTFLDTNGNGTISIHEFCMFIEGVKLTAEMRMSSFSVEFEAQLKTEIERMFDMLDLDGNGALTADELVQIVRPSDSTGSDMSLKKAR